MNGLCRWTLWSVTVSLCLALLGSSALADKEPERNHDKKSDSKGQAVTRDARANRERAVTPTREWQRPSSQSPGNQSRGGYQPQYNSRGAYQPYTSGGTGSRTPGWQGWERRTGQPNRPPTAGWRSGSTGDKDMIWPRRSDPTAERKPTSSNGWEQGSRGTGTSTWQPRRTDPQPESRPKPTETRIGWQQGNRGTIASTWQPRRTDPTPERKPTPGTSTWQRPGHTQPGTNGTPATTAGPHPGTFRGGWERSTRVLPQPKPASGWTVGRPSTFTGDRDWRSHHAGLWDRFSHYRRDWGEPHYFYRYVPFGHSRPIEIHYYYPCYYYRPGPVIFYPYRPYHFGYYPAPFCSYGWFSFWLPASVVIIERTVVLDDDYWYPGRDSSYPVPDSARDAMADIRDAWLDNRPELIQDHLQQYGNVRIYFRGRYAYSIVGEDYYQMVQDAFSILDTERFELGRMHSHARDEAFVQARHTFYDPEGDRRTVEVGYTLRRMDGNWYITAVDSSSDYMEVRDNR